MSEREYLTSPADTMRERREESRFRVWFLVRGNRFVVSVALLSVTLAVLAMLIAFGPTSATPVSSAASGSIFGSMIIVVVTGVTFVLAVAQLVLSEELGPLGEKHEEMEGALSFREEFESVVGAKVSPPEPSQFLRRMIRVCGLRAERILDMTADADESDAAVATVREYADEVAEHSRTIHDNLEGTEFGTFGLLQAVLDYNYSWKLSVSRTILETHGDELPDPVVEQLDELDGVLRLFGPAREYIKTLYFRWEVIELARLTMYTGLVALGVAGYMIILFDSSAISGVFLGIDRSAAFAAVMYVITLSPFAVLLAYILRIITVAKWTLALGVFILRKTNRTPADEQVTEAD